MKWKFRSFDDFISDRFKTKPGIALADEFLLATAVLERR